jgi:hypothetical protein
VPKAKKKPTRKTALARVKADSRKYSKRGHGLDGK